jgi:peptidoglycan hydrolase-like protein with peptidoglycan-binding domain
MPEGRSDNGSARATGAKDREAPLPLLLAVLGWTPRDAVAFVVGIVAVVAILVNSLSLQSGSHPAPLFEPAEVEKTVQAAAKPVKAARLPQVEAASAPVTPKLAAPHALRTPGEIITDVQRELARRGYFDGPVDGLYGPRTQGAIRDFERAVGLKPSTQPGEALLEAITRSPLRSGNGPGSTPQAGAGRAPALRPTQPAAVAPAQVVAVQRALSEFGYGQIRTSGTLDPDTQRAIAAFERQRNLPITGQLSEQVIRELSAVTGRTLE